MDVLAVREAVRKATEYVRAGNVCCIINMFACVYMCVVCVCGACVVCMYVCYMFVCRKYLTYICIPAVVYCSVVM